VDKSAKLWKMPVIPEPDKALAHGGEINAVAFSPDGRTVVTASRQLNAWDPQNGERQNSIDLKRGVRAVAFGPAGDHLVAGTQLLSVGSYAAVHDFPLPREELVCSVAFSSDGNTVFIASHEGSTFHVRAFDVGSGQLASELLTHKGTGREHRIVSTGLSPRGELLIVGCEFYKGDEWHIEVQLWHTGTGQQIYDTPIRLKDRAWCVGFGPDGETFFAGTGNMDGEGQSRIHEAKLWEVATKRPLAKAMRHYYAVTCMAYSPRNRVVVTGEGRMLGFDSVCGAGGLWDVTSGLFLGDLLGHRLSLTCAAFSPDGKMVVTGSMDGTARVWDVPQPALDDPERLELSVQVRTSYTIDEQLGTLRRLSEQERSERKRKLDAHGGPCDIIQ